MTGSVLAPLYFDPSVKSALAPGVWMAGIRSLERGELQSLLGKKISPRVISFKHASASNISVPP